MASPEPDLLNLRGFSLDRRDGQTTRTILSDIDLDLPRGAWVAILGGNGSGKSSLLKFLASDESPLEATRAIMFQDPDDQIIASTVSRELSMGRGHETLEKDLADIGLEAMTDLDPRVISAGQKQRLVLAVTLGQNPEILFCDEPTSLQDERQRMWVLDRIQSWRNETGGTVVTATCDRLEVDRADYLLVLEEGRVALQGSAEELRDHELVRRMLGLEWSGGGPDQEPCTAPQGETGSPALELKDVGFQGKGTWPGLAGIDLSLKPGQKLGLTGPNGCGKSTLLASCVGARRPDSGQVRLGGHALYSGGQTDLDHGLALLAPQFPEYLFTRSSVVEELRIDPGLIICDQEEFLARLGLPPDIGGRNPHSLSSGQKRRLALGMVLFSGRPLLLLDEPTAALDHAGKRLVRDLVKQVPRETAILVASHDRDFLVELGCSCLDLGAFAP